jgi:hypothetical protein
LSLASGEKLQDDERLLKKTIKRKEKQKSASTGKWQERKDTIEREQRERQEKRQENVQKRIDEKKSKLKSKSKSKPAPRKGRAGFEGSSGARKK